MVIMITAPTQAMIERLLRNVVTQSVPSHQPEDHEGCSFSPRS